jgi:outer membrane protein
MKHSILLLCALLFSTMAVQAQQSFTLQQAVEYAQANQQRIVRANIGIADADARIAENSATARPQISASLAQQSFLIMPKSVLPKSFAEATIPRDSLGVPIREVTKKDRQLVFGLRHALTPTVQVNQLLFSGSYLEAKRAAAAYREYSQQNLVTELNAVEDQVQSSYLPALLLQESVMTLDRNLTNLDRLRNETNEFYKAGFVELLDIDRLDLTISNLRTERENLIRQKEMLLNVLKFQMGFPLEEGIVLSDSIGSLLQAKPSDAAIAGPLNFSNRPEVQLIEIGKKLQSIQYDVIKAGRLPTVAAFGSFQVGMSSDNPFKELFAIPTSVIGLQANIPIYDSGVRRQQLQRSKLSMKVIESQQEDMLRGFTLQAQNARIGYLNAVARVESQTKNLALAERIYNTAQTKYRTGVGSSLETVQAEQSLFSSQQNLISARFELLQAQIGLQQALGN